MRTRAIQWLAVAMVSATCQAAMADSGASLVGTWLLDDRSSDDPVRELLGRQGDGLGRRIVRSVNVFGIPVGSLPLPDGEDDDEPSSPEDVLGALAYVFEATYRLRIAQHDPATEIRYGNAPTIAYRASQTLQRSGWTSKAEWRDGELAIEHERAADGAHISERYRVDARAGDAGRDARGTQGAVAELHWTVRLKRAKSRAVDVKRVFYRAPGVQDAGVPLTARLSP